MNTNSSCTLECFPQVQVCEHGLGTAASWLLGPSPWLVAMVRVSRAMVLAHMPLDSRTLKAVIATRPVSKLTGLFCCSFACCWSDGWIWWGNTPHPGPARIAVHAWQVYMGGTNLLALFSITCWVSTIAIQLEMASPNPLKISHTRCCQELFYELLLKPSGYKIYMCECSVWDARISKVLFSSKSFNASIYLAAQ